MNIFRLDILLSLLCLITLSLFLAASILYRVRKKHEITHINQALIISCVASIASFLCLITVSIITAIGFSHGMYDMHTTVTETIDYIGKTPVESQIPDDLSNKLVIYYKFDCADCHAIYADLKKATQDYDVIWVSTRSKNGKKLRKTYPVEYVPTGIAFNSDKQYISFVLYKSENGKIILDSSNLDLILNHIK